MASHPSKRQVLLNKFVPQRIGGSQDSSITDTDRQHVANIYEEMVKKYSPKSKAKT